MKNASKISISSLIIYTVLQFLHPKQQICTLSIFQIGMLYSSSYF